MLWARTWLAYLARQWLRVSYWHWWGKLNQEGYGAVVVVRGSGGKSERKINIPWVADDRKYRVSRLFDETTLGIFAGKQLKEGAVRIDLPPYGQDILELASGSK